MGTKAVNALSDQFEVTSFREKKSLFAQFKSGELKNDPATNDTNESNGTKIRFTPDSKLFPNYSFDLGTIRKQLWNYAYLNRKLTITLNGEKFKLVNDLPVLCAVPSYIHCSVLEVLGDGDHPLFLCMVENVKLRNSSKPLELRKTGWKYGG